MAKRGIFMSMLSLMLMCVGIKIQSPVRRIKAGRSFKLKILNKCLSSHGKRGRSRGSTFKIRPGR